MHMNLHFFLFRDQLLTLSENKSTDDLDLNEIWMNFEKIFDSLSGLIKYRCAKIVFMIFEEPTVTEF